MPLIAALLALAMPQASSPTTAVFDRCLEERTAGMLHDLGCYTRERERLTAEQAMLLGRLSTRLKQPGPPSTDYAAAAAALAKAQAAWITYLGADCEIVDHVFGGGNARGFAGETCLIDHYRTRNAVLRDWLRDYLSDQ
jgi:uncharacterized protein YecT (DUF1311 family)